MWRTTALIGFNTLVLFLLSNVIAEIALELRESRAYSAARWFHRPSDLYRDDRALLERAYPGKKDDEIRALIAPPNITDHPVLGFMERPIRSAQYNVGFENMRHSDRVDETNARRSLDGSIWVFGGSTLFGHGVPDAETIPAQLGRLDPEETYLNFGVQGYDSSLELAKLTLLLKKGHRPKAVIFLDGLNDMLASLGTDFLAAESPTLRFSAYAHSFNVGTFDRQHGFADFLRTMPLSRWVMELRVDASEERAGSGWENVDDPDALYHRDPWLHFKRSRSSPYVVESADLPRHAFKLKERLRQNQMIARGLGRAFDFPVHVFLQPIGLLSLENPFVRDPALYRESEVFLILRYLTESLRASIAAGQLDMIDVSDGADQCGDCYVDLAHYDAKLSKILAERMLATRK